MATLNEHSNLIAIFATHEQAHQCIDALRNAGYGHDQLRLVERGTNSFVENVKNLFTAHPTAITSSAEDWTRIGVPEQDAHNYQRELDTGRSIVLIKSVGSPEQALGLLRQGGAYDIAFRWRTTPPTVAPETTAADARSETRNP